MPQNLVVDTFPDPCRPFWGPLAAILDFTGGERVPPAPLGWYSVQYQRAALYAKQYWVSDFKDLINLVSLNLIPPQFIQNFSRYEHFRNVTS